MAKKIAAITTSPDTVMRSEVHACSAMIEYLQEDRQIRIRTEAVDESGNPLDADEISFYALLSNHFDSDLHSLDSLRALEDCLLFGLTEIAKQRAKLSA